MVTEIMDSPVERSRSYALEIELHHKLPSNVTMGRSFHIVSFSVPSFRDNETYFTELLQIRIT
jgi:hypothetical protein